MTRFQICPETELACKYNTPLYKTQNSEILVQYVKDFNMNTEKLIVIQHPTHHNSIRDENSYIPIRLLKKTGRTVGKLKPQDKSSTRLRELSFMNKIYFRAIHYDIH